MKVIGISGKKLAGKDTFFSVLKEINPNVKRVALADALKDEVYEAVLKPNGLPREILDLPQKKYFRLILQGWGTDFRRMLGEDAVGSSKIRSDGKLKVSSDVSNNEYWIDKAHETLCELAASGFNGTVVITDVRYKNEADWIIDCWDGNVIRINRPRKGIWGWILDRLKIVPDKHISETDMDDYDAYALVVNNKGSIEDLKPIAQNFYNIYLQ